MKKNDLVKLDLTLYSEVLDNGLRVYVVPFKNSNNIYTTFSTDFGSIQTEFVPFDGKKMIKVPDGIAHFLEHKMFEQKDGIDPFSFFSERGADANANTNQYKTTYIFSGPEFFEENLNYLLDYVQEPYFTNENVEKEKGIIEQEMKMYQDNPYSVIYEKMMFNMFVKDSIKQPIIGNYKSIYAITKEDLYNCYNTFYHPSNMFIVVTGNVNPEEVINIVKENQEKKNFIKKPDIKVKEYKEPTSVAIKEEYINMNVNVPKVGLGYKLDISKIDVPLKKIYSYINLLFSIKFDSTSFINEELKDGGIITDELYLSFISKDNIYGAFILGESKEPELLIEKLKEVLEDLEATEEEFSRKIKATIAALIGSSDNIYVINNKIVDNIIKYKKVVINDYDIIRELNLEEFREVINALDFNNTLTYIINPK